MQKCRCNRGGKRDCLFNPIIRILFYTFIDQIRADLFLIFSVFFFPYKFKPTTDIRSACLLCSTRRSTDTSHSRLKKLFHFPRFCNRFDDRGVSECCTGRLKPFRVKNSRVNIRRRAKEEKNWREEEALNGFLIVYKQQNENNPVNFSFFLSLTCESIRHVIVKWAAFDEQKKLILTVIAWLNKSKMFEAKSI